MLPEVPGEARRRHGGDLGGRSGVHVFGEVAVHVATHAVQSRKPAEDVMWTRVGAPASPFHFREREVVRLDPAGRLDVHATFPTGRPFDDGVKLVVPAVRIDPCGQTGHERRVEPAAHAIRRKEVRIDGAHPGRQAGSQHGVRMNARVPAPQWKQQFESAARGHELAPVAALDREQVAEGDAGRFASPRFSEAWQSVGLGCLGVALVGRGVGSVCVA